MNLLERANALLEEGKIEEYSDLRLRLHDVMEGYFKKSGGERHFGYEMNHWGDVFSSTFPPMAIFLLAVSHDKKYVSERAAYILTKFNPLQMQAFLYDVRGKNFFDVNYYKIQDMEPKSTIDLDQKKPIKSIRDALLSFETIVFEQPETVSQPQK